MLDSGWQSGYFYARWEALVQGAYQDWNRTNNPGAPEPWSRAYHVAGALAYREDPRVLACGLAEKQAMRGGEGMGTAD